GSDQVDPDAGQQRAGTRQHDDQPPARRNAPEGRPEQEHQPRKRHRAILIPRSDAAWSPTRPGYETKKGRRFQERSPAAVAGWGRPGLPVRPAQVALPQENYRRITS